jgi:hypothetical protein
MRDDQDALDLLGQGSQRPVEDGPALHGQHRFGRLQRMRPQTGAQASRQNDRIHTLNLLTHSKGDNKRFRLRTLRRLIGLCILQGLPGWARFP